MLTSTALVTSYLHMTLNKNQPLVFQVNIHPSNLNSPVHDARRVFQVAALQGEACCPAFAGIEIHATWPLHRDERPHPGSGESEEECRSQPV